MDITVDGLLKILGALSPIILLLMTAVLKRRYDRALAAKTEAETSVQQAVTEKTRAEIGTIVIDQASRLVDEFKELQNAKDQLAAERQAASDARLSVLGERVNRMEEYFARLRAALAVHGTWDAAALVELKERHPDYPSPPTIPDTVEER